MEFSCGHQQLLEAVQVAERLVGKKDTLPVLSCVRLETKSNILSITATNLDAGIEIHIPAKVIDTGVVAVPASIFSQTIRAIQDDKITIKNNETTLIIQTTKGKTVINTIAHDEFPSLPKIEKTNTVTIDKQTIIEGITSVAYAAATSLIRPEFASVYFSINNNTFVCVATDSFRLAEKRTNIPDPITIPEILIPTKNALELVHVLEHTTSDMVSIAIDDGQLSVFSSNIYYISRIVDASFPHYQTIIPKEYAAEITVLKADIVQSLRKARLFSHTNQQVQFSIDPKEKKCIIHAHHSDVGEMNDSLDAVMEGEPIDIKFNIQYISDCFNVIPQDSVTLKFAGNAKPLVIRPIGDNSFMYLVMPLNR
jgi:DNA polymerase-3 subunit beta